MNLDGIRKKMAGIGSKGQGSNQSNGDGKDSFVDRMNDALDEVKIRLGIKKRTESDQYPENDRGYPNPDATDGSDPDDGWRGGTWEDSGYVASDEEAHRNRVYTPPSFLVQMFTVMFAQMKLFGKGKATLVLLCMIVAIPAITLIIPDFMDQLANNMGVVVSNAYTGFLLVMLPAVVALFTAKQCGPQIPNEFKEKTAYMSIPLPMHRLAFYFGKYLAGFLYCLALFLLAFGVAVACTELKYDEFYIDILLQAFVGTVVAILVYSSTAFCIGCFLKRGSVLAPLILNMAVLPMVFFLLSIKFKWDSMLLAPIFLPDAVVQSLGFPMSGSMMGMLNSTLGVSAGFGDMWTMCALGVLWSVGFLLLGAFRMTRREM